VALGDSVMLGARPQLLGAFAAGSIVDAKVSRTLKQTIAIAQSLKDQGLLGEAVVLHVGNNGSATAAQVAEMMGVLADVDRVVWVNVKLPGLAKYAYQDSVNGMLAVELTKYPNARLVDWHSLGNANPAMFYKDGTHLKPSGATYYTQQVAQALA
jgi:hypothetical protein